jgi:hypothetical protein
MADPIVFNDASSPVRLRAHTLLCLQGFRGEGYNPEFVDNMGMIHKALTDRPETTVEVLDSPDAVCGACPHRRPIGCTLNSDRSEEEMRDQDHEVLRRLELKVGDRLRWQDILKRIRSAVSGEDLPSICGSCRWLPLGYCREGLNRLRNANPDTPIEQLLSEHHPD